MDAVQLTSDLAAAMARLAVANIGREYPNAPGHLLRAADDLRPPRELHPAFYGSWDWHSSVHQHWLLVRLLRLGIADSETDAARTALRTTLRPAHLEVEAAYLRDRPGSSAPTAGRGCSSSTMSSGDGTIQGPGPGPKRSSQPGNTVERHRLRA